MAEQESIIKAWFESDVIALRPPADWRPVGLDDLSDFRFIAEMLHHMEHGTPIAETFRQQAHQTLPGCEHLGGEGLDGATGRVEMIIGGEDWYGRHQECAVRHRSWVWCERLDDAGYPAIVSVCPWEHGRSAKRFGLVRRAPGDYDVVLG